MIFSIILLFLFYCFCKVIYRALTNHDIPNTVYCADNEENKQILRV